MNKITAEHLQRNACVYIRQSTPDQLVHNLESQRRQYGLSDRARQLGWTTVEIIDDDLGRSGGGIARPGFERLLAAICDGRVGAVLAIEASRLARNGRDWHTLIEFCGLVGTILVDEDGIYDPRHPNDRLLLGMKGTMSELELSLFRQRSQEALRQMARRGALVLGVAAGYVKVGRDRIERNPDKRVQRAIRLVFTKFRCAPAMLLCVTRCLIMSVLMDALRMIRAMTRGVTLYLSYLGGILAGGRAMRIARMVWRMPGLPSKPSRQIRDRSIGRI